MKVGDAYFLAGVDDAGKAFADEWILRTIRGGYGFLVMKADFVTWGKRSSKTGDYGWLDPIDPLFRRRFRLEDGVPADFARSSVAAYRKALAITRARRKRYGNDVEAIAECEIDIAALAARVKRLAGRARQASK